MSKRQIEWLFSCKRTSSWIFIDSDQVLSGKSLQRYLRRPRPGVLRCRTYGPPYWEVIESNMNKFLTDLQRYRDIAWRFFASTRDAKNAREIEKLRRQWVSARDAFESLYQELINRIVVPRPGAVGAIASPPGYDPTFFNTKRGQPFFWKFVNLYNDLNIVLSGQGKGAPPKVRVMTSGKKERIIKLIINGASQADAARNVFKIPPNEAVPDWLSQAVHRIIKDLKNPLK